MPQTVFKRYEIKYFITPAQKQALLRLMQARMQPDGYGKSTIRNLYYDTPDYRLVRRSNEKPLYKEKLRMRSYAGVTRDEPVFVELKKKYRAVVYKRRLEMTQAEACAWLAGDCALPQPTQIGQEIDYFRAFYGKLMPQVFLSYEREAFYACDDGSFRVTFDENILSRTERVSLCEDPFGTPLLPENTLLMEIKTAGAIPLWLTAFLTENRIFKTSFSKYGEAYRKIICKGALKHVG